MNLLFQQDTVISSDECKMAAFRCTAAHRCWFNVSDILVTTAFSLIIRRKVRCNNFQLAKVQCHTIDLENVSLPVATKVTCRGVIFDSELTFSEHVTPVVSRLTSSFTCQLISITITTLVIHHSLTLSLQARNLPFQQILPTLDFFIYRTAFMTMGLDRTYHAHCFIFSFTF